MTLASYEVFADDDQLLKTTLHCMLYDMPTKNYGHGIDDYSDAAETSGISKSTVSQQFIKASAKEAGKMLSRRFDENKISVILIDGIIQGGKHLYFYYDHADYGLRIHKQQASDMGTLQDINNSQWQRMTAPFP